MKKIHKRFRYFVILFLGLMIIGNTVSVAKPAYLNHKHRFEHLSRITCSTMHFNIAFPDSVPLTKAKVRDFIKTRIATYRLQMKMKKNASQYDDVVQVFYKKRKTLLESRGWTVKEFESTQIRIDAATNGMEAAAVLEAGKKKFKENIADIRSNEYYSKKYKAQLIKSMYKDRKYTRTHYIEPTKADWPAVKPYRKTLKQLTDWIDQNISKPPEID